MCTGISGTGTWSTLNADILCIQNVLPDRIFACLVLNLAARFSWVTAHDEGACLWPMI